MRSGDVSVTSPFRYSIVLWALAIDAIVFGNRPDLTMIVGLTIVVASGIYMIVRERQINRAKDADQPSS
jgi:drug/metabolite transporter (DMT)-like permease